MGALTREQVEEAYRRYFPIIVRKSGRMLRDTSNAQDLAQETFLRLWRSRLDVRDAAATTAWLYKTCTRLALDRLRSAERPVEASAELTDAIASPDASAEERSHHRALLAELLVKFPQGEIEAAVLSRVDGLNHQEIGEVLGISERSVRRLLARIDARIGGWRARREALA